MRLRAIAPGSPLAAALVWALFASSSREVRGDAADSAAPTQLGCPPGAVLIPAGTAGLGVPDDADALAPLTRSMEAYCLDRTEVTVSQYRGCVAKGACVSPPTTVEFPGFGPPEPMKSQLSAYCNAGRSDKGEHPMNCVDEASAGQFCAWEGGRLPTEEEWEYAARGPEGSRFPWGASVPTAPGGALCWDRRATSQGTCAVGQFPLGASPSGALDMAGNVWEWTSSRTPEGHVVRGGGWTNFLPRFVSATYRWPLVATTRLNCVGFRCVRPAIAPAVHQPTRAAAAP
jgi:formylglycine-generating enzyme required for sulfatase activity